MKEEEVIKLGENLGLSFNRGSNYEESLAKGIVVFDGCNGQRVLIECTWDDEEILETFGQSLIHYGEIKRAQEISQLLNPW
jgi:hypothetical protein